MNGFLFEPWNCTEDVSISLQRRIIDNFLLYTSQKDRRPNIFPAIGGHC
jgi:hypothetical protein